MDWESGKQQFLVFFKKYQYLFLVVLLGVFLMLLPDSSPDPEQVVVSQKADAPDLEEELSEILSHISGVGKTRVLLTEASGSDTIYQTDAGQNQTNLDTVIVTDGTRAETGLVKQVIAPVYKGAIVVCQGGDSAQVRLWVSEAVKSVTGLSSACITVLKMK